MRSTRNIGVWLSYTLVIAGGIANAAETARPNRWAIVATHDVRQTGLPDLLTASLSREPRLELVERDEIDRVTRELELATYFGARAASSRLTLGKLLRADVLLLLSLEKVDDGRSFRVVIADCSQGARLRIAGVPLAANGLDKAAERIAVVATETRRSFADGIRHLVGVTPFVSKNLTHDYDPLQSAFAVLLTNSLTTFPGVAALEIDEALAIQEELRLTDGQLSQRLVPIFVEGEFEVSASPEQPPSLRLSMRIRDGDRVRSKGDTSGLSFAQATQLLTEHVPNKVVQLAGSSTVKPLTPDQQRQRLLDRGDTFAALGSWPEAIGMYEAARLVAPDDVDAAIATILAYKQRILSDYKSTPPAVTANQSPEERQRSTERAQETLEEQIRHFHIAGRVLQNLVDRKLVTPNEAVELTPRLWGIQGVESRARRKELQDELHWSIWPRLPELRDDLRSGVFHPRFGRRPSTGAKSPEEWYEEWAKVVLNFARQREGQYQMIDVAGLAPLYRALTEVTTRESPVGQFLEDISDPNRFRRDALRDPLLAAELGKFYARLQESTLRQNVLYGRFGLLVLRVHVSKEPLTPAVLAEIDDLSKLARGTTIAWGRAGGMIQGLRREAADRIANGEKKRHRLPANPILADVGVPPVVVEPLDPTMAEWFQVSRCNESLDLLVSFRTVAVRSRPGAPRAIFSPGQEGLVKDDLVTSAVWDGKNIWSVTQRTGVRVFNPEGELLIHFTTEQGLPEHERVEAPIFTFGQPYLAELPSLWLYPVEPGHCLAIGRYGKNERIWFATLSLSAEGGRVNVAANVFHTITDENTLGAQIMDAHFRRISWTAEYRPRDDQRLLLLGRRPPPGTAPKQPTLAVDLKQFKVDVFPWKIPAIQNEFSPPVGRVGIGEHVFQFGSSGVERLTPAGADWQQPWTRQLVAPLPAFLSLAPIPGRSVLRTTTSAISFGQSVYWPDAWLRIDTQSLQVEPLASRLWPRAWNFEHWGVSAHDGPVVWNRGDRLYRLRLDGPRPTTWDDSQTYFYVPEEQRAAHAAAIKSIRELGGKVDTWWDYAPYLKRPLPNVRPDVVLARQPGWRTVVYLPREWRGGDAGLAHLKHLFSVRDVFLVQCDVSNEGLRVFADLNMIESLRIVETKATDAGLESLRDLPDLRYLRLEGTVGGKEFTDEGLQHVAGMKGLQELVVYGSGFTLAGVDFVRQKMRVNLHLLDTAVTGANLNQLPGIQINRFEQLRD